MNAIEEFFYFSGYAWYVWGSYGITAAFMIAEVILVIRSKNAMVKRLARMARLDNSSSD